MCSTSGILALSFLALTGGDNQLLPVDAAGSQAVALSAPMVPALQPAGDEIAQRWMADFDLAAARAKAEGKDLLVDFTGSDWCTWCIRLDEEVFDHAAFLDPVSKDYVLLKLDFPRGEEAKQQVPNEERNSELATKYGITGFPSILLMKADGTAYAQLGYAAGGPEPYVTSLYAAREKGLAELREVKTLVAAFESSKNDEERWMNWSKCVEKLEAAGPQSTYARLLAKPVKWALEADESNAKGHRNKALKVLLTTGQADSDLLRLCREADARNVEGLYEQSLFQEMQLVQSDEGARAFCNSMVDFAEIDHLVNTDLGVALYLNAAIWSHKVLDELEQAKKFASIVKAFEVEDEQVDGIVKEILES